MAVNEIKQLRKERLKKSLAHSSPTNPEVFDPGFLFTAS